MSVGSLGQYAAETDIVANISVSNIIMANAQNGARIKVFGGNPNANSTAGGGTGYVKVGFFYAFDTRFSRETQNVTFTDFYVKNVDNPIVIDQVGSLQITEI